MRKLVRCGGSGGAGVYLSYRWVRVTLDTPWTGHQSAAHTLTPRGNLGSSINLMRPFLNCGREMEKTQAGTGTTCMPRTQNLLAEAKSTCCTFWRSAKSSECDCVSMWWCVFPPCQSRSKEAPMTVTQQSAVPSMHGCDKGLSDSWVTSLGIEVFCVALFHQHFDSLHVLTVQGHWDFWCVCESCVCRRLVSSSFVIWMVHSEVVQWCTVKYFAVFLSLSESLRYPRTRWQRMKQGRAQRKTNPFIWFTLCPGVTFYVLLWLHYREAIVEWQHTHNRQI